MGHSSEELISLADFIQQIKMDLAKQQSNDEAVFYIDGIEIEAQVVATKEQSSKADVGLKLSILNFGAGAGIADKTAQVHTQKLKVSLSPIMGKDELKAQLAPEDIEKITEQARKTVFRGASPEVLDTQRAAPVMRGG